MNKRSRLVQTAYHEAGHYVAAVGLGIGVKSISIEADGESLGRIIRKRSKSRNDVSEPSEREVRRNIVLLVAGHIAEEKCRGRKLSVPQAGSWKDFHEAVDLALYVCSSEREASYLVSWLFERCRNAVEWEINWWLIEAVAAAILERKTLNGKQAMAVYRKALNDHPLANGNMVRSPWRH
jgi:hypothetical protein